MCHIPGIKFEHLTPKEKILCKKILADEIDMLGEIIELIEIPYPIMKEYLKNRKEVK